MNALEKALLIKELHQLLDGLEHRSLSFFETAKSKSVLPNARTPAVVVTIILFTFRRSLCGKRQTERSRRTLCAVLALVFCYVHTL